jgi:hypothetical protein
MDAMNGSLASRLAQRIAAINSKPTVNAANCHDSRSFFSTSAAIKIVVPKSIKRPETPV